MSKQQLVPKMRGEEKFTVNQQLLKVREEIDETLQAPGKHYIEEIGDLLHSFWVLVRVIQRQGIDPRMAIERVVEKNRRRGYYDEDDTTQATRTA